MGYVGRANLSVELNKIVSMLWVRGEREGEGGRVLSAVPTPTWEFWDASRTVNYGYGHKSLHNFIGTNGIVDQQRYT